MSSPRIGTNLVSRQELARRAGTTPGTVDSGRRRHPSFPAPFYIGRSPAWHWPAVARWLAVPRRPGRPRSTPAKGPNRRHLHTRQTVGDIC